MQTAIKVYTSRFRRTNLVWRIGPCSVPSECDKMEEIRNETKCVMYSQLTPGIRHPIDAIILPTSTTTLRHSHSHSQCHWGVSVFNELHWFCLLALIKLAGSAVFVCVCLYDYDSCTSNSQVDGCNLLSAVAVAIVVEAARAAGTGWNARQRWRRRRRQIWDIAVASRSGECIGMYVCMYTCLYLGERQHKWSVSAWNVKEVVWRCHSCKQ